MSNFDDFYHGGGGYGYGGRPDLQLEMPLPVPVPPPGPNFGFGGRNKPSHDDPMRQAQARKQGNPQNYNQSRQQQKQQKFQGHKGQGGQKNQEKQGGASGQGKKRGGPNQGAGHQQQQIKKARKDDSDLTWPKAEVRHNAPWNLPSKARVLLVSNLHPAITQPIDLFNLFSFYGDVMRAKMIRKKERTALIEFKTAKHAYICREALDQFHVRGMSLFVTFSKFERIKTFEELPPEIRQNSTDDGSTGDFSSSDYDRYRYRFSDRLDANGKENPVRPIYLRNIARCSKPSRCIQVTNIPEGVTADQIAGFVTRDLGLKLFVHPASNTNGVLSLVRVKKPGGPSHNRGDQPYEADDLPEFDRQILLNFMDSDDGIVAMAKLPGWKPPQLAAADRNHVGLKCYNYNVVVKNKKEDIQKKKRNNTNAFDIVPNNICIPHFRR